MIINWEKGKRFYAGSLEMLETELFTFANLNAPRAIEMCSRAYSDKDKQLMKDGLRDLKASSA